MVRRRNRVRVRVRGRGRGLLGAGYYREDGTRAVSYRDTLHNTFRFHHHDRPNVHNIEYVENTHTTETETPNTAPHVTSHGTGTDSNNTRRWTVALFLLCFLLFIGMTSMYFQLTALQQKVDTLELLVRECHYTSAFLYGHLLATQFGRILFNPFSWM